MEIVTNVAGNVAGGILKTLSANRRKMKDFIFLINSFKNGVEGDKGVIRRFQKAGHVNKGSLRLDVIYERIREGIEKDFLEIERIIHGNELIEKLKMSENEKSEMKELLALCRSAFEDFKVDRKRVKELKRDYQPYGIWDPDNENWTKITDFSNYLHDEILPKISWWRRTIG